MTLRNFLTLLLALSLAACGAPNVGVEPTPTGAEPLPVTETALIATMPPTATSTLPGTPTSTGAPALPTTLPTAEAPTTLPPTATGGTPTRAPTLVVAITAPPASATVVFSNAVQFTVHPPQPLPGEQLTFAWAAEPRAGGHCVTLTSDWALADVTVKSWCNLPDTGTLTVSLPTVERDRFRVYFDEGQQSVEVRLPCPDEYFFSIPATLPPASYGMGWEYSLALSKCPTSPVTSAAFEQTFERGRMLQFGGQLYALLEQGNEGGTLVSVLPFSDTTPVVLEPPAGLFAPDATVFARAWQTATTAIVGPTLQEALGWATAPMQSFPMLTQHPWATRYVFQADSVAEGGFEPASGPNRTFTYLRQAEGRTLFLSLYAGHGMRPYWIFMNP